MVGRGWSCVSRCYQKSGKFAYPSHAHGVVGPTPVCTSSLAVGDLVSFPSLRVAAASPVEVGLSGSVAQSSSSALDLASVLEADGPLGTIGGRLVPLSLFSIS